MRARAATFALLAGLAAACATAPPPQTAPPPRRSLEDLQREYLERIAENERTVDVNEGRKSEIVRSLLDDRKRAQERRQLLVSEIETREKAVGLLDEQIASRRARAGQLRDEPGSASLIADVEAEIGKLGQDRDKEAADLAAARAKLAAADAELARLGDLSEDELFLEEMQPLYREGIDLHLGFYRGVIEVARQRLGEESDAAALIDRFSGRIDKRRELESGRLEPATYADLRHEFELDRRVSQAWLSAYILDVRFSPSAYQLDSISGDERHELELVAEALRETWSDQRMVMFIDGHADSRKFRGTSDCVSATKNRELSRQRAEAVAAFFGERLGGAAERIRVDWFGNFSLRTEAQEDTGETENRRIELRVTSQRENRYGSHSAYFAMRDGLDVGGRTFFRRPGEWVDERCRDRPVAREIEYLSPEHRALVAGLGLDAGAHVTLGERALLVGLGNAFVVEDDGLCVQVRPCPEDGP